MWTWIFGSEFVDSTGFYGIKGVPDINNQVPARWGAVGWVGVDDSLWLFGGGNLGPGNFLFLLFNSPGYHNDLWKFNGSLWTWIHGSNQTNQNGVYGTQGIPFPTNAPGARFFSAVWKIENDFWLFGGYGRGERCNGSKFF